MDYLKEINILNQIPRDNENHDRYYLQKAKMFDIKWDDINDKFMGMSIEYWHKLYTEDKHFNNHSLHSFDLNFRMDKYMAGYINSKLKEIGSDKRIGLSLCCTVCMRKAVIRDKVLSYIKTIN